MAAALAALLAASGLARADEPKDGIPDPSIATSLPDNGDPGGVRKRLSQVGITFQFNTLAEYLADVSGGVRRGGAYQGREEAVLDLDMEKLAGWKGLTLHANGFRIDGGGIQANYVGNLLDPSYIEARPTTRLYELWAEQKLFDDKLAIRVGQLGADSDFFISSYANQFVNTTFGFPGILSFDLPSGGPEYPLAALGARVKFEPAKGVTLLYGIYDGDPAGPGTDDPQVRNAYGTNFRLEDPPLMFAEGQYAYNQDKGGPGLAGTIRLGGWYHAGSFADQRFASDGRLIADPMSSGVGLTHHGDYGLYAVIDQQIWKLPSGEPDKGAGVFARVSGSPSDRNLVDFYADGGIVFSGIVPGRPDDSFGFSAGYLQISGNAHDFDLDTAAFAKTALPARDYEAAFEFNYQAQVIPGWTIDADVQYIVHPGAGGGNPDNPAATIPDALVIGTHTQIKY